MTADPSEILQLREDISKVHDKVDDQARETRRVIAEQTERIHCIDKTMIRVESVLNAFKRPCADFQLLTAKVDTTKKKIDDHVEQSGEVKKVWHKGMAGTAFGLLKLGVAGVAGWAASHLAGGGN